MKTIRGNKMGGTRSSGSSIAGGRQSALTESFEGRSWPATILEETVSLDDEFDLEIQRYGTLGPHFYGTITGPNYKYSLQKTLTADEADFVNGLQNRFGPKPGFRPYRAGDKYWGWESRDELIAAAKRRVLG